MTSEVVYLRDLDGTGSLHVCSDGDPGAIEHIPITHAQAMVAAAYGAARNTVIVTPSSYAAPTARITLATAIDGLTPDAAKVALDALLKAEREAGREAGRVEALREAASKAAAMREEAPTSPAMQHGDKIESAILALIEKETGHE